MSVWDWSTSAAGNAAADAGMPLPIGALLAKDIDDRIRSLMQRVRYYADDTGGALVTAGSGNAYTVTTGGTLASLRAGVAILVRADRDNTGDATLEVDDTPQKSWLTDTGSQLPSGSVKAGRYFWCIYHAPSDSWRTPLYAPVDHGQCRLTKSSSNLLLSPFNGNRLVINNAAEAVPASGPTLSASGLSAGTLYYIYAYMNSGTMTLEASTTVYAAASNGVHTKSGDTTRTLVGMARPISGPAWQDTDAQRLVRSWFNRGLTKTHSVFTATRSTTSTSYVELGTEIRNEALIWAGEAWALTASGTISNSTIATTSASIGIDGTSPIDGVISSLTSASAGYAGPASPSVVVNTLSEGYHYATVLGQVNSGTGSWSSASAAARYILSGVIG